MDQVIGEIRDMREEMIMMSGRVSEHSDQLESHETRILKLEKQPKKIH